MLEKMKVWSQYILPQHTLSRALGMLGDSEIPWLKRSLISMFAKQFKVDMSDAIEEDLNQYPSFNSFFTRALKPEAREIDSDAHSIVSPADGVISQLGDIQDGRLIQAKGRDYSLLELVGGSQEWAKPFQGGRFITVYLAPFNYHRVHMPLKGTLIKTIHIPGRLFSVGFATSSNIPNLFARNERLVCVFSTDAGLFSLILVGAMVVGSIKTVWTKEAPKVLATPEIKEIDYRSQEIKLDLDKGAEVGRFELGSTVIVLFEQKLMQLNSNIVASKPIRMGESLGLISNNVK